MPTDSPTTIDVHAHALSPRLVELTADRQGPPNPHNDSLIKHGNALELLGLPT